MALICEAFVEPAKCLSNRKDIEWASIKAHAHANFERTHRRKAVCPANGETIRGQEKKHNFQPATDLNWAFSFLNDAIYFQSFKTKEKKNEKNIGIVKIDCVNVFHDSSWNI